MGLPQTRIVKDLNLNRLTCLFFMQAECKRYQG